MKNYSHIIWDWNGTLFNDVDWCVKVINSMLMERSIKPLDGLSGYHKVFRFPIIDYYVDVGFDFSKEPFEVLAEEYISKYHGGDAKNCSLHKNAENVLKAISEKGVTQIILSASEKTNLLSQMNKYDIKKYFDAILGISDIYAESKIGIGLDYISGAGIRQAVLIGDTTHDYEVSRALGADCILIANGHQSREKLISCGASVLDDIAEVLNYI